MSKRPTLRFFFIILILLGIGFGVKAYFFSTPQVAEKAEDDGGDKSRQELIAESTIVAEDVELVQGRQGAMEWKLLARTAKYNREEKLVGVTLPRLTAFYGKDRNEIFVQAERGEVDQSNDNLELFDNVSGQFGELAVTSQHLDYVGSKEKVYLDGGVVVTKPDMKVMASTAEIDLVSRKLTAEGGVEALLSTQSVNMPLNQ